jgi:hypothetical protein
VTKLLAVLALDLGIVPRQRAITREMALLFAVAASNVVGIPRLGALLGHVVLRTAVIAGALGDVGALMTCISAGSVTFMIPETTYVLGEVAGLVALAALDTLG